MELNNELLVQIAYVVGAILLFVVLKLIYSKVTSSNDTAVTSKKKSKSASEWFDVANAMASAENVIIVPGYGMAIARAQHEAWELAKTLQEKNVRVSFAINPVAGRMPGHMDILLADAGVPYEAIHDLNNSNDQFPTCDVALVIGANDTINPAARDDTSSPIYGMPILDVDKARKLIVIKRGQGTGHSDIENQLFDDDNTRMCFGDAKGVVQKLIADVKLL
jgi:NAD(P) transhydrogenase subunit beta